MNTYIAIILFALCVPSMISAMNGHDMPPDWLQRTKLSELMIIIPVSTRLNVIKEQFIAGQCERLEEIWELLKIRCVQTNGVIRITTDPELAKINPNVFLYRDAQSFSAQEIDEMITRIHHAMDRFEEEHPQLEETIHNGSSPA